MRLGRKVLWLGTAHLFLLMVACVTINIYFPAEKVESVAEEIVDEIRGDRKPGGETSLQRGMEGFFNRTMAVVFCRCAWADDVIAVSNATIRALKSSMKGRYPKMKPYYQKGLLSEGNNGYVSVKSTAELGLKQKRDMNNLVKSENQDRERLYEEVARAMKIDLSQTGKVAEIFAKEWQASLP